MTAMNKPLSVAHVNLFMRKGLLIEVRVITPDLARQMLTANIDNRPLNKSRVRRLANEMSAGRFVLTHQGIAFDETGRLVDGQHRLHAIIEAGRSIQMLVTLGLPPSALDDEHGAVHAFEVIDQSGTRSAADILSIDDPSMKNTTRHVGVARAMASGIVRRHIGTHEAVRLAKENSPVIACLVAMMGGGAGRAVTGRSPVIAAFCNAIVVGRYEQRAVLDLASRLTTQTWESETDPMKTLFLRLLRESASKDGSRTTQEKVYGLTVSAIRNGILKKSLSKIEVTTVDFGDNSYDRQIHNDLRRRAQ